MRANHTTQPNRLEALTQTPAMAGGAGPSTSVLGASMRHRAGERERANSMDHTRRVANHCGFRVTPLYTVWLRMATLADGTVWRLEAHYAGVRARLRWGRRDARRGDAGARVRILWAPPPRNTTEEIPKTPPQTAPGQAAVAELARIAARLR